MAYDVLEKWSDKNTEQQQNGWGATRYFSVVGTTTELLDERGVVNAPGIPQINESHPQFRDLRVANKSAGPGLSERVVSVRYSWLPNGGNPDAGQDDPLQRTPDITWGIVQNQEQTDQDIYGNPLANSAGDVFDSLPSIARFGLSLEIVRWESFFDVLKSRNYFNKVNSTAMVAGGVEFLPRTVLCTGIVPSATYKAGQSPIQISYNFEIRSTVNPGQPAVVSQNPFAFWRMDVGLRSFAANKKDPYDLRKVNDPMSLITAAVRLNGSGAPYNAAEYAVISSGGTPATPTNNPTSLSAKVRKANASNAWYLGYDIYEEANLLALGL